MTFGTAQDLSSQVVAIPLTSFGMLMNSRDGEFQRIRCLVPGKADVGGNDFEQLQIGAIDHSSRHVPVTNYLLLLTVYKSRATVL